MVADPIRYDAATPDRPPIVNLLSLPKALCHTLNALDASVAQLDRASDFG